MSTDVLEKLKQLPPDKQQEVDDFIAFLLHKYSNETTATDSETTAKNRMQLAGRLKGTIWMADDFNDTPEDFKDYI